MVRSNGANSNCEAPENLAISFDAAHGEAAEIPISAAALNAVLDEVSLWEDELTDMGDQLDELEPRL